MLPVNLKSLISNLNSVCRNSLEAAAGLCLSRTHYNVEIEHWLAKLLETADNDIAIILKHFEIDAARLNADLTRALDKLRSGNAKTPSLSPDVIDWARDAWLLASLEFQATQVRSGHLLLALLADDSLIRIARDISGELQKISVEALKENFNELVAKSPEASEQASAPAAVSSGGVPVAGPQGGALDQFTIDLTERARQGKVDPVLGRDAEIRQIADILLRRRQNNPILTGEAGVGKTAVVEGFALQVVQGFNKFAASP